MTKYKINEKCIIGMPKCNYGYESSRMCFIARPADQEFQLEEEILTQLLADRNYDNYVALQKIDPGNFAFCTKICSKIITSQFCIVLLNLSSHTDKPDIKIPNPNVHFEYGMMLGFHKHVIPIQKESEELPFNIYPIDTIKYTPGDFKKKAQEAIDDAILRFTTKEPPGRPIGSSSDIFKYFAFQGLRYTDVSDSDTIALYRLGDLHGFNLFDGENKIVYFGYFYKEDPKEIVTKVRFLINNINIAFSRILESANSKAKETADMVMERISIEVLVPENTNKNVMESTIKKYQQSIRNVPVLLHKPSDITEFVRTEYDKINI